VGPGEAAGLVWLTPADADALNRLLDAHPGIGWVQFPWAGVEKLVANGVTDRPIVFTSAKGLFAEQVAEHALTLALACLRSLAVQARTPRWHSIDPASLFRRRVTVVGAGGTARELVRLLAPFGCEVRVVRRSAGEPVAGAARTLPVPALPEVLPDTDVLVLALALTPGSRQLIGARELAALPSHAVLVNVARGAHVDTDALVAELRRDGLAAAGLDVTDPEPLPEGHPLWSDPRVLITSHCADSAEFATRVLCGRVARNVANLRAGRELEGRVDPALGY
ncbi:NAD(P)-dependent oxidoreductase, partial [Streptomyces calidiresistens]